MWQSRERWIAALRSFVIRMAAIALLTLIVPVTPSLAQRSGHVRLKIVTASVTPSTWPMPSSTVDSSPRERP